MQRGAVIVFEGAEGVGKTTQIRRLADALARASIPCVTLREPGGTSLGESIRSILLDPAAALTASAEALLFLASRAQLIATEVRPALARGEVVLLDRFFLSTYAYQVAGRGLDEEQVRAANRLAVGGLVPDVTLVLKLPALQGLERAATRGVRDRMELADHAFHERVGAAFELFTSEKWLDTHPECGPVRTVDASGSESEVAERVRCVIAREVQSLAGALNGAVSGAPVEVVS
jgi:dTMP kinase